MPPALGFDPGFCATPAPRAFRGLAWLQACSVQSWSSRTKFRNAGDRAAPGGAKVRPAGRAGRGFQRRTRTPGPAGPHTLQLPASRTRVPILGRASVASPSFAFVSQVTHNYLFPPNPRPTGTAFAPRCQERAAKSFAQSFEMSSYLWNTGPSVLGRKQRPRPRWG